MLKMKLYIRPAVRGGTINNINLNDCDSINITFENCETANVPFKYVEYLVISGLSNNYLYIKTNHFCESRLQCDRLYINFVEDFKNLNYISFDNKEHNLFKRIIDYKDIVYIELRYKDDSSILVYLPYQEENGENLYQKVVVDGYSGVDLYVNYMGGK